MVLDAQIINIQGNYYYLYSELQIRQGTGDNSRIFFLFLNENIKGIL